MSRLARVVEAEPVDGVGVALVEGEVDASNAATVAERLRRVLTNHSLALVVDLTPTTYLDSAGVNVLFELAAALEHRQQRLHVVVAAGSPIARVLEIVRLERAAAIHPTREAALQAVAPSVPQD